MTNLPSRIPLVKASLVTVFKAGLAAQAPNCDVRYGVPLTYVAGELVAVANARAGQDPMSEGNQSRREDFVVDVVVFVGMGGSDQQIPTERAFALLALVEGVLRADPQLKAAPVPGLVQIQPSVYELEETTPDVADQGRFARIVLNCRAIARI